MNRDEQVKEFLLYTAIKKHLLSHYILTPKGRYKRGTLQRHIASDLNLVVNNKFYTILKKITTNLNIKHIKLDGVSYYKGISKR